MALRRRTRPDRLAEAKFHELQREGQPCREGGWPARRPAPLSPTRGRALGRRAFQRPRTVAGRGRQPVQSRRRRGPLTESGAGPVSARSAACSHVPTDRWRRSPDARSAAAGNETVVLHLGRGSYATLNETASWIWARLDHAPTLAELRDGLTARFAVEPEAAWRDLLALVDELERDGLITRAS
jgi:hypothetical protein